MFERFTKAARASVIRAQALARESGADLVQPWHLLSAVTESPDTVAARSLESLGVPHARLREVVATVEPRRGAVQVDDDDAEALRAIGIDVEEVVRKVDEGLASGPVDPSVRGGRNPRFAKECKKVLELALREALALKHNYIGTEHILLGLLRVTTGEVPEVFHQLGVDLGQLRVAVATEVRRAG